MCLECKSLSTDVLLDWAPGYKTDQTKDCQLFKPSSNKFSDQHCDQPVLFACKKQKACCKYLLFPKPNLCIVIIFFQ